MLPFLALVAVALELTAIPLPVVGFASPAVACYVAAALLLPPQQALALAAVALLLRTGARGADPLTRLQDFLLDAFPAAAAVAAVALVDHQGWLGAPPWLRAVAAVQGALLASALPRFSDARRRTLHARLLPLAAAAICTGAAVPYLGPAAVTLVPALLALRHAASLVVQREEEERRLFLGRELDRTRESLEATTREKIQLRGDLRGKVEEYVALEELATALTRAQGLQQTADAVLRTTTQLVHARSVAVFLDGAAAPLAASTPDEERLRSVPLLDLAEPAAQRALATQQPQLNLTTEDPRRIFEGDRRSVALPLGTRQGVLYAGRATDFSAQDLRVLTIVAGLTKVAIEAACRLQESEAQLVQSSKLAAVGQLAAGVAHELNTPLGAVLLAIDMARKLIPTDPSKATQRLEKAAASIKRAQDIIERLLYYSRDAGKGRQPTDLAQVARDAVDLIEHQLDMDGVRLETDLKPITVTCNQNELYQVITNLLLNARDAVISSGRADTPVTLRLHAENGHAILEVHDPGPPIPADIQPRLFDPFFTTKPVGEGTGLGLSVSQRIVHNHGGTITFTSTPTTGTTFTVTLPM